MKKFLFLLIILPLPAALPAEVSFVNVTGTDEYTNVGDFKNTYDIRIPAGGGKVNKCQAVRVHKNWFFTAAHCVSDGCRGSCAVQIILFRNGSYEAYAEVKSTAKNPAVFFDKRFNKKKDFDGAVPDIAAIKYNPSSQRIFFVDAQKRILYTPARFASAAPGAQAVVKAAASRNNFSPQFALVSFKNNYYKINRIISLLDIDGAAKSVKISGDYVEDSDGNKNPAYFLKDFRIVMLQNFGSKRGLSGSGMMANTGELLGINSFGTDFELTVNGKKQAAPEYAGFATFNDKSLKFLENSMGDDFNDLTIYDAEENNYAERTTFNKLPAPIKVFIKQYRVKTK